jgi:hypothetical protein
LRVDVWEFNSALCLSGGRRAAREENPQKERTMLSHALHFKAITSLRHLFARPITCPTRFVKPEASLLKMQISELAGSNVAGEL